MNTQIDFSEIFWHQSASENIAFSASLEGQMVKCSVSYELLALHFGAKNKTPERTGEAFREHFAQFCEAARKRITKSGIPSSGEVSLTEVELLKANLVQAG